ncbi:MAG: phosphodiester glycosidase family protein [Sphingomonadaceae bacterium]
MKRVFSAVAVIAIALVGLWIVGGWQKASPTNVKSACTSTMFERDEFTICRYDPQRHRIQIITSDDQQRPLRSFAALRSFLGSKAKDVAFAMNGGMFDTEGQPIGLSVEGGQVRHPINLRDGGGNFHLMPNGVFWVDRNGAHVADSATFDLEAHPELQIATQSGPMLVNEGKLHPRFSADGASRYIRNGVGIGPTGQPIFAISKARISFGKFARLFRDHLKCQNALFLDGYVSSLWDGASGRSDTGASIGPIIVVSETR